MTERKDDGARHKAKMAHRKAVQDAEVASKTIEKGLLMVHTGTGKGKSTAAFGLALRMIGRGRKVGVVQFIKGAWSTGEKIALEDMAPDMVEWHALGEGFTWETQDKERDIAACRKAWETAVAMMANPDFGLVVLDELNIALRYDYLSVRRGARRASRAAEGAPRRGHRPERQGAAGRGRRSGHRDDPRQAPLQGRREDPGGHRILMPVSPHRAARLIPPCQPDSAAQSMTVAASAG